MANMFNNKADTHAAMENAGITDYEIPANFPDEPMHHGAEAEIIPFKLDWPAPSSRFMDSELPPAPALPLDSILPPKLAYALTQAAKSKSAPVDYVFAGLLSVAASLLGNTRWASPQAGWKEPPAIWTILIGLPSAGKSPALDSILGPLRDLEKAHRKAMQSDMDDWEKQADVAKLAEAVWKSQCKKAIAEGETAPDQPDEMTFSPQPYPPRYIINDGTIEKITVILGRQARGSLQSRDELSGWLQGMERYSDSSDRGFWLESYGGRAYTVERMGREPLTVDHLLMSVTGGIQPEKLNSLLLETDNDGLVPRFIPIWPEAAPIHGPMRDYDDSHLHGVLAKLASLQMPECSDGDASPLLVHFTDDAANALLEFRKSLREMEGTSDGLMTVFLGKMAGLAVRLTLVLAFLAWASGETDESTCLTLKNFNRARLLIETYILPMALRTYGGASVSKDERLARKLVSLCRENQWSSFSTRDVLRLGIKGLDKAASLNPILTRLEDADVIKPIEAEGMAVAGRPTRMYAVNPAIL